MSLLGKLFGGRKPEDRLRKAERLVAAGELGLARLELEAAVAAPGLDEEQRAAAQGQLHEVRGRLARQRLDEARTLVEAGETGEARHLLEVALALEAGGAIAAEVEELLRRTTGLDGLAGPAGEGRERLRARDEAEVEAEATEPAPADEDAEPEAAESAPVEPGAPEVEGDEEMSAFELALMAFPEQERELWEELVERAPGVAEALELQADGELAEAIERWRALEGSVAAAPLVRRELGRLLLMTGQAAPAREVLEQGHQAAPEEPTILEQLMVARLAVDDVAAAVAAARRILERGAGPGFGQAVSVLAEQGHADEALERVDDALDRLPANVDLWQLRARICELQGDAEGVEEADDNALDRFRVGCVGCGTGAAPFPLLSARRTATRLAAGADLHDRRTRERLLDLVRLLVGHDDEQRRHWQELLRKLES